MAPTIFFTPGGWHDPSCFDSVRSILSTRGFETEASPLATVGCNDASVGVFDDAKQVRSALTKLVDAGKEVVLVPHSYGGIVVSNAVEGLGIHQRASNGKEGGVIMILYLAACAIPAKTSFLMNYGGSYPDTWIVSEDELFVMPDKSLETFYADVEPSLANKAVASLRVIPLQTVRDVSAYEPWNEGFEVGYVFTEEDRALPMAAQKAGFSMFPAGSFNASLASSHSPFLSMPDTVADTIQNATEFVLKKRSST
ncbi:hypothetical protein HD806DRAFT_510393 [Xylariaceae sp. AK1471]|nr:hypothetical protein HD806DRAFT_510393 [Xylariaceae sp. AK1471]